MLIYLTSNSALKKQAVETILKNALDSGLIKESIEIKTEKADSGVPDTPHGKETMLGARNRALWLWKKHEKKKGNIYIGIESGLVKRYSILFEECWCIMVNGSGKKFFGYSSGLSLPESVGEAMKKGHSHIDITNHLGERYGISGKDTWGVYTKTNLSRKTCIEEAVRNAFLNYIIQHEKIEL